MEDRTQIIEQRQTRSYGGVRQTPKQIVVAPGFAGRGYVVVDGWHELRAALRANGVAEVVLQGTRRPLKLRRNENGDLVEPRASDGR